MDEHYFSPEMLLSNEGYYCPLCPVEDEFVAGEIVNRWFHREQSRHLMDLCTAHGVGTAVKEIIGAAAPGPSRTRK